MTNSPNDDLLLKSILDQDNGVIANIIQAASELDGSLYDRLSKGYFECTRGPLTPTEEQEFIGLSEERDEEGEEDTM